MVVLSELPATSETILLRLLGPSEMRQRALAELHELPLQDPDRHVLLSTIGKVRFMIERDPKLPQEAKEELMTAMHAEFEQFKQTLIEKGVEKGIEKGIGKGKAQAVIEVLEARGVAVPEGARARILSCTDLTALRRWLTGALRVQSVDELFAETTG